MSRCKVIKKGKKDKAEVLKKIIDKYEKMGFFEKGKKIGKKELDRYFSTDKKIQKIIKSNKDKKRYKTAIEETLRYLRKMRKNNFPEVKRLIGDLGEYIFCNELSKNLKKDEILFHLGGTCSGFDIYLCKRGEWKTGKKIQIKTQLKGTVDWTDVNADACPSIGRKSIENEKFDYIVLIILDLKDRYQINEWYFYPFTIEEVKDKFSYIGCWTTQDEKKYRAVTIFIFEKKINANSSKLSEGHKKIVEKYNGNIKDNLKMEKKYIRTWIDNVLE